MISINQRNFRHSIKATVPLFLVIIVMTGPFGALRGAPDNSINDNAKAVELKIKEYLNPEEIVIGVFPNTDGFMDAKFLVKKNYLTYLSSGIDADYTSRSASSAVKGLSESETLTREVITKLSLISFQLPFELGGSAMAGINAGVGGLYLFSREKSAGYKKVTEGTVYFHQKKDIHNLSPVAGAGICGVFSRFFSFSLLGGYTPLVYIKEDGEKNYSTYENPITYTVTNYNSAMNAEVSLMTHNLPFGDFEVSGRFIRFFGDYQTHQELVLGNYRTTVKTFSSYKKEIMEAGLYYKMTFLKRYTSYMPILSFIYSKNLETLDGTTISDESLYKLGIVVAVE